MLKLLSKEASKLAHKRLSHGDPEPLGVLAWIHHRDGLPVHNSPLHGVLHTLSEIVLLEIDTVAVRPSEMASQAFSIGEG